MKGGLLLNVLVGEGMAVLKLLSSEDKVLPLGGDVLLVLNLGLDVVDGIGRLDLEGNGLTHQGLDKDLHSTMETEDQVEGRFLPDGTVDTSGVFSISKERQGWTYKVRPSSSCLPAKMRRRRPGRKTMMVCIIGARFRGSGSGKKGRYGVTRWVDVLR